MAQQTALGVMALPGMVHSFVAKTPAAISGDWYVVVCGHYLSGVVVHDHFHAGSIAQGSYDPIDKQGHFASKCDD